MKRRTDITTAAAIESLLEQRRGFMEQALRGERHVLASIQFIDNVLGRLVPGYEPDFEGLTTDEPHIH